MIKNVKYKQGKNTYDVKIILSSNKTYLLEDSLPSGIAPKAGDKILWDFEVEYFLITDVKHLIMPQDKKLHNYAIELAMP